MKLPIKPTLLFALFLVLVTIVNSSPPLSRARRLYTQVPAPENENSPTEAKPTKAKARFLTEMFSSFMNNMMGSSWGSLLGNRNAQISFVPLGSILFQGKNTTPAP